MVGSSPTPSTKQHGDKATCDMFDTEQEYEERLHDLSEVQEFFANHKIVYSPRVEAELEELLVRIEKTQQCRKRRYVSQKVFWMLSWLLAIGLLADGLKGTQHLWDSLWLLVISVSVLLMLAMFFKANYERSDTQLEHETQMLHKALVAVILACEESAVAWVLDIQERQASKTEGDDHVE